MAFTLKGLQTIDRKMIQKRILPVAWLLLIGLFLVGPILWARFNSVKKLNQIQDTIRAAHAVISKLPQLKDEEAALQKKIDETRASLFTTDEINSFIAEVSELARKYNAQIVSSRPRRLDEYIPKDFQGIYTAYEFEIDITAEYHSLGKLLADLYQKPKVLKLEKLSVIGRETVAQLNQISLSLVVISASDTESAPPPPTGNQMAKKGKK